jgi:hypothetical protein
LKFKDVQKTRNWQRLAGFLLPVADYLDKLKNETDVIPLTESGLQSIPTE